MKECKADGDQERDLSMRFFKMNQEKYIIQICLLSYTVHQEATPFLIPYEGPRVNSKYSNKNITSEKMQRFVVQSKVVQNNTKLQ